MVSFRRSLAFACNAVLHHQQNPPTWSRRSVLGTLITTAAYSFPALAFASTSSLSSRTTKNPSLTTCTASTEDTPDTTMSSSYLNAESAFAFDQDLMSTEVNVDGRMVGSYTLEQLMELAGLSVAQVVYSVLEEPGHKQQQKVLILCGPGNNGGDGLVAARHLVLFGYACSIVYPKQGKNPHYELLVQQCRNFGIDVVQDVPSNEKYTAIVDAFFGFSFKGTPREPYARMLTRTREMQKQDGVQVFSVDVPSGWNVDTGGTDPNDLVPDVLISLTAPKPSARNFRGRHFVGGRFVPAELASNYNLVLPSYSGISQFVEITES